MPGIYKKTVLLTLLGILALWAALKFLLPLLLPFLMGSLLALAAEPMVKRCRVNYPGSPPPPSVSAPP